MRGADWDEMILLLFGEEVFLVFSGARKYLSSFDDRFGFRRLCLGVTHPQPLSRGEVRCYFLVVDEWVECGGFPS